MSQWSLVDEAAPAYIPLEMSCIASRKLWCKLYSYACYTVSMAAAGGRWHQTEEGFMSQLVQTITTGSQNFGYQLLARNHFGGFSGNYFGLCIARTGVNLVWRCASPILAIS